MHESYLRIVIQGNGLFPCPLCRAVTEYQYESHAPVVVDLAGAVPVGEKRNRVRCLSCDTVFGDAILDATGAKRPHTLEEGSANACLAQQADVHFVCLTDGAQAEVRRRMASTGPGQTTGVRLVRDRKRHDRCLVQFDTLEFNAEYDVMQREAEFDLILDRREAEKLRGATIDYVDDEFVVSTP